MEVDTGIASELHQFLKSHLYVDKGCDLGELQLMKT